MQFGFNDPLTILESKEDNTINTNQKTILSVSL